MQEEEKSLFEDYQGVFVVIDGPNGSGKTTVTKNVLVKIIEEYPSHVLSHIKEPSDSDIGALVRKYSEMENHKLTLLYLVAADRQRNHVEHIIPSLKSEKSIVISERYISSTLVYQRMHSLSVDDILKINYKIYVPDIIFLLECHLDVIRERLTERGSNFLFERPNNVEAEICYRTHFLSHGAMSN